MDAILDPFQRPFLGAPSIIAVDVAPRPIRRTADGRAIGPAIRPSAGIRADYNARLRRLIDEMHNSILYWVKAAYHRDDDRIRELAGVAEDAAYPLLADRRERTEMHERIALDASPSTEIARVIRRLRRRWLTRFRDDAEDLARHFATAVHRRSDAELRKILKHAGIGVEFRISRSAQSALTAIVNENVSLIRSIPEQYLTQVEGAVMRSIVAGRDLASLTADLQHQHGVARRRAELISLDQNNKASSAIQRIQYLDLGISRAIWRHSHAGREPRPTHVAMDGEEYDVAKGMWDPAERAYIAPGQLIRCRCYSQPILPR